MEKTVYVIDILKYFTIEEFWKCPECLDMQMQYNSEIMQVLTGMGEDISSCYECPIRPQEEQQKLQKI